MIIFKQTGSPQQAGDGILNIFPLRVWQCWSGNQDDVPPGLDGHLSPCSLPHETFCPIAYDCVSNSPPGCKSEASYPLIVDAGYKNGKRVRIGFSFTPHPFEISRTGEPVSAVHPLGRPMASILAGLDSATPSS